MRRILHIMRKEFLQLRRDRRLLPLVFMSPVIQLVLLGYAATTDLKNVPVAVCDLDRSSRSRDLLDSFTASGDFVIRYRVDTTAELDRFLDDNKADVALTVPWHFAREIDGGKTATVQVLVDGSKANATVALGQLANAVGLYAQGLVLERMEAQGLVVRQPGVVAESRVWYNPDLSSRDFMVPGVFALVLMVITSILTSMAIVKEKESGTIEQIIVTPVRSWQLILGKLIPFAIIGFVDLLIVLAVVVLWFKVPMRGSPALLLGLSVLFMLNAQGIGLFVSTISHTQQQAMMTAMFFVMMPMMLLSGFAFPIENMPHAIQYVTYLLPMRYYLVILRGIFLKGIGMSILWPQALALAVFGVTILTLAVLRFQKRVG